MSLIKANGAGDQSTGFYKHLLDQSIKIDRAATPYLTHSPSGSDGNLRTWAFSCWLKRSSHDGSATHPIFQQGGDDGNNQFVVMFYNDTLYIQNYTGGAAQLTFQTTQLFRDVSSWGNLVISCDTTQSTEGNRFKIFWNGSQIEAFGTDDYPSQNADTLVNDITYDQFLGRYTSSHHFDGYIAEVNFIDGTALDKDSFGETKNNIWIPKDTSGLTFGTHGFHLTFKDDVVSEGFNALGFTGSSGAQSLSGLGFSPDLVWNKRRNNTDDPVMYDVVRGTELRIYTSSTTSQNAGGLTSFDSDGFSWGSTVYGSDNNSNSTYIAWCWEAGGAPTADNSAGTSAVPTSNSAKVDGSNHTSALSGSIAFTRATANTTERFSIIKYTGNGSGGATVDHLLGETPDWIIVKRTDGTASWQVFHTSMGPTKFLDLHSNSAVETNSARWNDTAPSDTLVTLGSNSNVNSNGGTFIMYCWAAKPNHSAFGSFTGNGGSQAIDVGFAPAWVMLRRLNGSSWGIFDNTRQSQNLQMLAANSNAVETSNAQMTFSGDTFNDNGYLSDNGETVLYMAFADTREAAFWKDVTSNGNHWTTVNLDYRDSVPDVPTNNFSVLNSLHSRLDGGANVTISEGNLQIYGGNNYGGDNRYAGTTGVSSGKWYFEMLRTDATGLGNQTATGVFDADTDLSSGAYSGNGTNSGAASNEWALTDRGYACNTSTYTNLSGTIGTVTQNKVVQVAVDMDNKKIWFGIDNTFSGDPAAGSGEAFSNLPTTILPLAYHAESTQVFNFGQDSSFAGNKSTANSNADGEGYGSFAYAPPSGFLALCSQNLPDVEIIDGTDNFNTVTYTGTGSSNSVTGVGFQPDWVWGKRRDSTGNHWLSDVVRGATKGLHSDSTSNEYTDATVMNAFNSDGFTVVSHAISNASSATYVAWNWLAGTAFSNDASATSVGSVDSEGQVNTKAGFSIITWTADGSDHTIAHGLSAAPEVIIAKTRSEVNNWFVYHSANTSAPETDYLALDSNSGTADFPLWNDTAPTSSVFTLGDGWSGNQGSETWVAYLFHSVEGYSKAGSYVGNGNADGTFVYTGFRPAWIMQKKSNNTGHWHMWDSTRNTSNEVTRYFSADDSSAEATDGGLDILSNGFKPRKTGTGLNASGDTYIYLAFAEQPFKFANAR
mgnify:CR=1 FL=1